MTVHPIHGVGSPAQPASAPAAPGVGAGAHRPTDLVEVSPAAALLRRLDALLRESPDRFRAVTARVAERLGGQAPAAEPHQALALTRLAERFAAASQAGSPAPLVAEQAAARSPRLAAPPAAGSGTPNLAAASAVAVTASAPPPRPARRAGGAAYREKVERAGGHAAEGEPGGGHLGALLAAVAGVVEAVLDAALREPPPEGAGPGRPAAPP